MRNIQINSKLIQPGDIFVAIPCKDVENHIAEAFQRGAGIVFAEHSENPHIISVKDARLVASKLAKLLYPEQPKICIAITGTNGKSSTAHFLSQIWSYSGKKSGNLGTLGLFIDQEQIEPEGITVPNLTTPDPITFHKIMQYLKTQKVDHCVFEASSHALDQKRSHGAELTAAAFTNLASDHLDYHKTREAYLDSKLRLFREILQNDKPAIVSMDFPEVYESVLKINKNIVTFGISNQNFIKAQNIKEFPDRMVFDLMIGNEIFPGIEVKLFGSFQIMNILCAIALAYASDVSIHDILKTLPKIKPLNGRMEHIRSIKGGNVYVDFAHTTDGFKNALECFKKACHGRLICVFGCGGDRDKSKRPEMGVIASEIADVVIITDDNPRTESPAEIRHQILEKCPKGIEIADRMEAIQYAISLIQPGDFVAVIGKGHENYQIYGNEIRHFNDREEILSD